MILQAETGSFRSSRYMPQTDPEVLRVVDAARKVWIRRLIDPSRANSLLFYRNLKVGTLDLSRREDVVTRLLAGEAVPGKELGSPPVLPAGADPVQRNRALADAGREAQHALLSIHRKAVSNMEEKGIETLFLSVGMATWPASDGGRPYLSPVVMVPARVEARGRGGEDLRLTVSGEAQINAVLLHVLEENYGVRISGERILTECSNEEQDGEGTVDPESVLSCVARDASQVAGFTIERKVVLGNFQFAKMAMVEDLKRNGEAMASSKVVAAVAGHVPSRQALAQAVTDVLTTSLDERPADKDYLVLDSDSTQQRCIALVSIGQNGVIQGPPGTGKSQTISNLIAQSVAEGKRVLFVAEKRAALDAVVKRLSQASVNLNHIILDLHGASVSRKEVMARIGASLDHIRHSPSPTGVEELHRKLEQRRLALNEHARKVNSPRKPAGLSVIGMMGRLLRLPTAARTELRFRGGTLEGLTSEKADQLGRLIQDAAAHPQLLLGTDPSPWNNAAIRDGKTAEMVVDETSRIVSTLWPAFLGSIGTLSAELGIQPPGSLKEASDLLALIRETRKLLENYKQAIFDANPTRLAAQLERASHGVLARAWATLSDSEFREARRTMLEVRTAKANSAVLREEALRAQSLLKGWTELGTKPRNAESTAAAAPLAALIDALKPLEALLVGRGFEQITLAEAQIRLSDLARDTRTPYLLPLVHETREHLTSVGLGPLLEDLRARPAAPEFWVSRFEYAWLHSALDSVLSSDPKLAGFKGRTHEQLIREFVELDLERVRLSADRVRRLHAETAIAAMNQHPEQVDLVRREAAKKSRHIPLRELLSKAPDVLTRIAPCWVASPLSVSQLLDGGARHFDIVVFDEASQVLQEEAIPSLYRASQVVVAGDRHQLPPTVFFATAVEGEDQNTSEDEAEREASEAANQAIGGFESLLATLESFLPNWMLEWHYRSEDERLIAFSNQHIYDGRLVTFPSARHDRVIGHTLVPHDPGLGTQEESASREVDEVVRQVLEHAQSRANESLGVIAMGVKHANRVQASLDRALEGRLDIADFFTLEKDDRFFVKNLETVQGDERDAIILTVGYGKTAGGDLPHRFGPLTQESGYRRLNVAVTRARRRMHLVSSFSHHEVDLSRSGSRGVQLLKAYLEYAANGGERMSPAEEADTVPLNNFEADIRDALAAAGIRTRPQFGSSRYRIDLVAMHPTQHGRPVLAIECDGASYHSGATARDRDRLRQSHLQKLGWRFHRIWSTDWFYTREQEIQSVKNAYAEAVERADRDADQANQPGQPISTPQAQRPGPTPSENPPVARAREPRPLIPVRESITEYSDAELSRLAEWVMSDGLLRTDDEVVSEMFAALPFRRFGPRIRQRLESIAARAQKRTPHRRA